MTFKNARKKETNSQNDILTAVKERKILKKTNSQIDILTDAKEPKNWKKTYSENAIVTAAKERKIRTSAHKMPKRKNQRTEKNAIHCSERAKKTDLSSQNDILTVVKERKILTSALKNCADIYAKVYPDGKRGGGGGEYGVC